MILETDTVTILVNDLTGVVEIGVFVDDGGRGFQHIDEEHAEKETQQEGHKLNMVEKFHFDSLLRNTIF
jgi:hypothetical protein